MIPTTKNIRSRVKGGSVCFEPKVGRVVYPKTVAQQRKLDTLGWGVDTSLYVSSSRLHVVKMFACRMRATTSA